ncbi:MAG: hypothetical protein B5M51_05305 [Anaerolinea sp. 4484_236]|nr:MAG: hypothetical protein B5M51_05305 [Anaerolinea sp. 4484_236]
MNPENTSENKKLCPTCGTKINADAERCLVCGSKLDGSDKENDVVQGSRMDGSDKENDVVQGSRMPKITLGLPAAIGLVAMFLAIGAVMVYIALQQTGQVVEPTATPTLTQTVTLTTTPTLAPPTSTYTRGV